ncbi:fused MFS/spermidine synthase [Nocardioidaceae bacterium]|nr:fused MFS/spermidine synthase [Nocardioidaceae bacterium]
MLGDVTGTPPTGRSGATLGERAAIALVFGTSAAVLVVELVALRLLAPYLGLTLETSTLVIGIALAAIAAGSWLGGRAADRFAPRLLLAPAIGVSGAAVALTPFVVRLVGVAAPGLLVLVSALSILVPGALLAAVTPIVTKLRLTTLEETGTVVGRLSGISTAGAIVGTVVTGFVLISAVPVSVILVGLGVVLLATAVVLAGWLGGWARGGQALAAGAVVIGGLGSLAVGSGCDVETTYHCAIVVEDPDLASGRTLVLDGLRHSYVDLADPTHLEFSYVKAVASAIDARLPGADPRTTHHLGAGGVTIPRWLAQTRPGTSSTVSEIDQGVVDLDRRALGLETGGDTGIEVRVEDGRLGLRELADDSQDLVVGDAFGGVSVPWHLTTVEALAQIERVLAGDGTYVVNIIDNPPMAFARAELATMQRVFADVALLAPPATLSLLDGGNVVAVASADGPLDIPALQASLDEREVGWTAVGGTELESFIGDSPVLTDDYAPVDQLLTPYGR